MSLLADILSLLKAYLAELAILGAVATFIWSVWQFFAVRRQESRNRDFEVYHRLIKELVQPDKDIGMYLDRQAAIVFELRQFKRYREVSGRILCGLKEHWAPNPKHKRLIDEIDLTIAFLEGRK